MSVLSGAPVVSDAALASRDVIAGIGIVLVLALLCAVSYLIHRRSG